MTINHLRLSVRDAERSARFYDPLMRALGYAPEPRDDDGFAWGRPDDRGRVQWLIITPAAPELRDEPHRYLAPGFHHLAFDADDRAHVDRVGELLAEQGADIIEPASEYDHDPNSYAVFFRDPDGHKLEVVHMS